MNYLNYLKILVEELHSATLSTIGDDGYPQSCIVDMMLYDSEGVYFLTAKGKSLYSRLVEQGFAAVSATANKRAVSLRGKVASIGSERLDEIFEKNDYMKLLYPSNTRSALEVFKIHEAEGEFFDISSPTSVKRDSFAFGGAKAEKRGYFIQNNCDGCGMCAEVCPQRCIDFTITPAVIAQNRCLRCGNCEQVCPKQAIKRS